MVFTLARLVSTRLNPRQWKGVGVGAAPSPSVFLEWPLSRRVDRAEFCRASGASFAQLLAKEFNRVGPGHGAITS